jgi:hypothetical protein
VAQTVTVTGVDDALTDGNITYAIVFSATTSSDPKYAGLTPASVTVVNSTTTPCRAHPSRRPCRARRAARTPSIRMASGPLPQRSVYCDMTYQGGGLDGPRLHSQARVPRERPLHPVREPDASGNQITCDHPMFNNSPTQYLYHFAATVGQQW